MRYITWSKETNLLLSFSNSRRSKTRNGVFLMQKLLIFTFRITELVYKMGNIDFWNVVFCSLKKQPPEVFRPATLLKKRLWHRCFPVNFVKFLRTPFLQNTSHRLLLSLERKDQGLLQFTRQKIQAGDFLA